MSETSNTSVPPHTPTPWSEFAESGDWWIQQCDADGNPIGGTVVSNANDMSSADMLFIVRAVNAHDAMLNAIARYLELHSNCDYTEGFPAVCPGVAQAGGQCHWCELNAARKMARGES